MIFTLFIPVNRAYTYLLTFGLFTFCAGVKTQNASQNWDIQTTVDDQGSIMIKLTNLTEQSINVIDPLIKVIERKSGNSWERITTPYCGCIPTCPNPPSELEVLSNASHQINWEGNSTHCRENSPIRKKEGPGLYRFLIKYKLSTVDKLQVQLVEVKIK